MRQRLLKSAAAVLLAVVVTVAVVGLTLIAGYWRSSFIRFASWQIGRPISVRGALHLHVLTRSPRIEAEQVVIGNPPWTKPGITAEVAKLTVTFAPLLSRQTGFSLLRFDNARLYFMRDRAGHANWQRADPDKSPGGPLPTIRALELTHTHLTLTDERLHLVYDGDFSIDGSDSSQPLQMEGSGTLNQHTVTFRLKGDSLQSAAPGKPYAFEFDERSSGAHITANGSLPRPFDLGLIDAEFDASGADLRDLYYLVGISLPNTGTFQLKGRLVRRDTETRFEDLQAESGQSDIHGRVSLVTQKSGRTLLRADLSSTLLRLADVGLRAAGRDPHPDAPPKVFSDVQLITPATRRVDATGRYSARRLLLSKVEVNDLAAPFTIVGGLVEAPEVSGHFLDGNFVLHLDSDANQTPALSRIAMTFTDLQLAQLPHQPGPPPYEGSLLLKIRAQGRGDSLHALASGAEGALSARVIQGTIRDYLAELIGVDLRGLGLTLTGSHREVPVRCAVADFEIHAGVMHPTHLFVDSQPVFISGDGRILLDAEALDLKLRGEPKGLRLLRLKAPILVQGTLLHPEFRVDSADSQFRLFDPGISHDADCAVLQPHEADTPAPPSNGSAPTRRQN